MSLLFVNLTSTTAREIVVVIILSNIMKTLLVVDMILGVVLNRRIMVTVDARHERRSNW